MIVTDILELSKDKVKVYIDNEFAFVLYKGEIRKYHIKKDEVILEEVYHAIMSEVLTKRAKLRCMNLLKSRDYTRYQLETKLKQGYYPQQIIDDAIDYCSSYGYIDDIRYAMSYINYSKGRKSRKQIEYDLQIKGVTKSDIEIAYNDIVCDDGDINEEELISSLIKKKKFDITTSTYEERQKIVGFLYRKGFSIDKIYNVLDEKN